jgi:hypothetical protein
MVYPSMPRYPPVIVCLLVLLAGWGPARAAAPPHRPRSTVYAWFPARFGSWKTDGIRWDCLTHLCFRSVVLRADGSIETPAGDPPKAFVEKTAHGHGVRVTVLAWSNSAQDSDGYLANAPERAAQGLLAYVRRNHLDGVNIDDEAVREKNAPTGGSNRDRFARFFRMLAQTFRAARGDYHLSYAAPPVISPKDRYGVAWLDLKSITDSVDAVIPMGYTMNPPSEGWSTNPEPLVGGGRAPWTTTRDLETMVRDYLDAMGGRKKKLLPGVSVDFGGYEWRCRTDRPLSPTLAHGVRKTLADCREQAKIHGERWNAAQQSPWYCYPEGNAFIQGLVQRRARLEREAGLDPRAGPGRHRPLGAGRPPRSARALGRAAAFSARLVAASLEITERFFKAHHVGEAGLDVEQRPFVRDFGAVLDRLAHDDRAEAVALRVRRRGADAGARRTPSDQQRVDAPLEQMPHERRPHEGAGVLLPQHVLGGQRPEALIDLARALVPGPEAGGEILGGLDLRLLAVGRGGEGDRDLLRARLREQGLNGGNCGIEPRRAAGIRRIGPAVRHVDDDERRASAEAEAFLEDAALPVIAVHRCHSGLEAFKEVHQYTSW